MHTEALGYLCWLCLTRCFGAILSSLTVQIKTDNFTFHHSEATTEAVCGKERYVFEETFCFYFGPMSQCQRLQLGYIRGSSSVVFQSSKKNPKSCTVKFSLAPLNVGFWSKSHIYNLFIMFTEEVSGTKADCIVSVSDVFLYYATISLSQSAMTKTIQSTQTHFFLEVWIRLVLLKYFVAWRFFDNNEESSCFMGNTDSCLNSPAFRDNKLCKISQCWQFRVRGRHRKSILSPAVCVFVSLLNLSRLYAFGWVERKLWLKAHKLARGVLKMFQGRNALSTHIKPISSSGVIIHREDTEGNSSICTRKICIWNVLGGKKDFFGLSFLSVSLTRYEIRDIHLVEESVLESLKVKADFHNFKPRPFNMREFYDRTGHDINDMLLSCHFHGTECRAEDFKVVSVLSLSVSLLKRSNIATYWRRGSRRVWEQWELWRSTQRVEKSAEAAYFSISRDSLHSLIMVPKYNHQNTITALYIFLLFPWKPLLQGLLKKKKKL